MGADVFGIVGTLQAGMFRVERVVAEGGFAVVYRAHHEGFRAPVALKCLKVPDAMSEAQRAAFLDKFREEGELLFRLSAMVPAVVRPLHVDVLVLGQTIVPFLALEWLEGEGLNQIVETRRARGKAPIDIRRLVPFLQPAAQALAQAHQVPGPEGPIVIIHRDIKPENIFVSRTQDSEVVKILDFGIARTKSAVQLDAGEITSSGALDAFTPGYAAPEQWLPKQYGQAGPWTDVFGLALTMVEVLAGRAGIEGDLGAMAEQTTNPERRPTPRAMGVAVSDAVEQAFARALRVDPRERTRSVAAFWTELEVALGIAPSIRLADTRAPVRSLTGASEPPPPSPSGSAPTPLGRAMAPTMAAPPVPGSAKVRRPDGDLPYALAHLPEPPAMPFELALPSPPPSAPLSGPPPPPPSGPGLLSTPPAVAAPPPQPRLQLSAVAPPAPGTLAARPRPGGRALDELREQLRVPITMVLAAIVMTIGDQIYTHATGELFTLASLRPVVITGPLALIGVGMACWRLLDVL